MINLSDDNLSVKALLKQENAFLSNYLDSQQKLNYNLHTCIREIVNSQVVSSVEQSEKFYKDLYATMKLLNRSNKNIRYLHCLKDSLNSINLDNLDYENAIEKYNNLYLECFDTITKNTANFEKHLTDYDILKNNVENVQDDTYVENTLLVSEIDKKVVLPYTLKDLNVLLDTSDEYKTLSDVIDKVYTKPLSYYSHEALARFKEAFKLVKEREKGSITQALDLAVELFSNYNLHPAIISACKNLNELDIYLSCLEYNELNDFHFFKTIFRMHPTVLKNATKIKLKEEQPT